MEDRVDMETCFTQTADLSINKCSVVFELNVCG